MLREIGQKQYSKEVYSDADMLLNFKVLGAVDLNKSLTYLWGKDSNQFPLLSLTEGQGAVSRKKPINAGDTQYKWKIMGRQTVTSPIVRLITPTTTPGKGFMSFKAEFRDNWIPYQYSAITPDGKHMVRMQTDGEQVASGGYIYEMIILTGDPNEYIDLSNFEQGKYWGMGAPTIAGELSTGSRSTAESWSEMTNQFGFHRFSKIITGNIANIVTEFELDYDDGSTSKLWMPFEMKQFELRRKRLLEEDLWFSSYNRDVNGVIHNQEKHSGKPIPRGAGVRDILIATGNYFQYAQMSIELIDMILSRIFEVRNDIDIANKEIVLYTGKGGSREFQRCIKRDAINNGYFDKLGAEEIQSRGGILVYGAYFGQYKHSSGATVSVKVVELFDNGSRAEMDRKNNRMYMGFPITSYTMVFLDHSINTTTGERNIQLVCEEGRESLFGVYHGLTPLPAAWGAYDRNLSTREDIATYEVMTSQGINMLNGTTSFWAEMIED